MWFEVGVIFKCTCDRTEYKRVLNFAILIFWKMEGAKISAHFSKLVRLFVLFVCLFVFQTQPLRSEKAEIDLTDNVHFASTCLFS